MAEPRLAKKIAIGLGAIEFLFGLAFAAIMIIQAIFLTADPNYSDVWLWPIFLAVGLLATVAPPTLAFIAERTKSPHIVYVCLAMLTLYPVTLIAWANFRGA